jgi:hypothetical protein
MEANMQHCTSRILSICDDIFNPESCHQLARLSGFIQRSSSKISGHELIKTLVLPSSNLSSDSLNGLCQRMKEFNPRANISASALAQRINTKSAEKFLKACFERALTLTREKVQRQLSCSAGLLKMFANVYIQDSTVFELNKRLSKFFPGTKRGGKKGGLSCKSQMKIDLIHNFTTGKIAETQICKGKQPDQALSEKILTIVRKGDLVIRDLGYFKIEILKGIDNVGAYFLTRFPSHLKVYLNPNDEHPVDLAKYLDEYHTHASVIELKVWISDMRFEVRLVAYRVPNDVVNKRLRKANKLAKEMGRTLSNEKRALQKFSVFVTNIPMDMVSAKEIGTIYRLRWEIELIFKTWKSDLKIDILEGICLQRVLCLIWGRLCMVILLAHITAGFLNLAKRMCAGELSPVKLIRYLLRDGALCRALQTQTMEDLEEKIIQDLPRRLTKDKRTRLTMRERVSTCKPYYEWCACA